MSMVFGVECPICGMDLVFADANHPPDECADQVAENERQVAAYKAEKAWSEELARRTKHSRRNCGMSPTDIMMPNDKPPVEVQMTEEEQVAGSCRKVTLVSPRIVKAAMDRTQIVGALKQRPASSGLQAVRRWRQTSAEQCSSSSQVKPSTTLEAKLLKVRP